MPHPQPSTSADSCPQRTEADLLRRDLRVSTADGTAFAMMVGVGETYLPAFVLAIGLGEVFAGLTLFNLVNAVAIVAGSATGGAVLRLLGEEKSSYLILFVFSSAARLLTLPLLRRLSASRPPAATVAAEKSGS